MDIQERSKGVVLGLANEIENIVTGQFDNENKYLIWVSDFFVNEVNGGAELCDDAAISYLKSLGYYKIKTIKSRDVTEKFLRENKNNLFVISNFTQLGPNNIDEFYKKGMKYIHYSHDHAYCMHRNPYKHGEDMKCNCFSKEMNIHKFLNGAIAIIAQTNWHKSIWNLNVDNPRVITIGSNLWKEDALKYIASLWKAKKEKIDAGFGETKSQEYIIFDSPYEHKNTAGAILEANNLKQPYVLVKDLSHKTFIDKLMMYTGLIFIPKLAESGGRTVVEARMCNAKIICNHLLGHTKEEWFKLKGVDLVDFLYTEQPRKFVDIIDGLYYGAK